MIKAKNDKTRGINNLMLLVDDMVKKGEVKKEVAADDLDSVFEDILDQADNMELQGDIIATGMSIYLEGNFCC